MEIVTNAITTAIAHEIANYLSRRDRDLNRCPNTHRQSNKAGNSKPTTRITTTTIKGITTINRGITRTITKTRKTITLQDRLGETQETGQEDTTETYVNCVEKKAIQQSTVSI